MAEESAPVVSEVVEESVPPPESDEKEVCSHYHMLMTSYIIKR